MYIYIYIHIYIYITTTWHRGKEYDSATESVHVRGGRHNQRHTCTEVTACRYWYELTDGYWGQFTITQLPHLDPQYLLPREFKHLVSMQNFVGMIEYLVSWKWSDQEGIVSSGDFRFRMDALPILVDDKGDCIAFYCPGKLESWNWTLKT